MLNELRVYNFAIIDRLELEFKDGLNVISGETGAGKSVLLKSLSLLMGAKASSDLVRTGCKQAIIEGCFDIRSRPDILMRLRDQGVEVEDDLLVVRRIVDSEDRSKVYLNAQLSHVSFLRELVAPLVEVAGRHAPLIEMTTQHENKNLLSKSYHLELLDHFAQNMALRKDYEDAFKELSQLEIELRSLNEQSEKREQSLDFLRFQRDEIATLNLQPGEEENLEFEVRRLKNLSKGFEFVAAAEDSLELDESSVLMVLKKLNQKGLELGKSEPEFILFAQKVIDAKLMLEEALFDLKSWKSKNQHMDSETLEKAEASLSHFRKMQKKYGATVHQMLQFLVDVENQIGVLENLEERKAELKKKHQALYLILKQKATELHKIREKKGQELSLLVNEELADLNMKGVSFHIQMRALPELNSFGATEVEFASQTSLKDPIRPLIKVSSGGELSRILLVLKKSLGANQNEYPRTFLFDEVDTGVSGETAEKVGRKLKSIAQSGQVICVTHLPQVAAFADHHFFIEKHTADDGVKMQVVELKKEARVKELARLISGEKITPSSLKHAKNLLAMAVD